MINWGIIGCGSIAAAFADEIDETGIGKLVAVYGRNKERVENFTERFSIDKSYNNIEEFLKDENIDAVYIATPHNSHMGYAEKCITNKKHVLCEKPFSYNYESGKRILDLARENNVFIMEALWTLFLPAVKKAKEWVLEGKIGKVNLITANFGFKSESKDPLSRLYNPELAGGALLDVGIYDILISNYIMGKVPEIISANAVNTKTNVDETTVMNFKYEDGALASLTCSISSATENTAVIYGEKGKITIPYFWSAKEAFLESEDRNESFKDDYDKAGYKYEIIEASRCIENSERESKEAPHKLTLELAEIMDEIRRQIGVKYPFE